MKHVPRDDHRGAGECGHGVQLSVQDGGNFVDEQITKEAAADSGEHSEDRGHERIEPERECLFRAGDSKQPETSRIEEQNGRAQPLEARVPPEGQHRRAQRNRDVLPATERRRWSRAEQDIPEHPAGIASDKGKNTDPEDIETVFHADCRTADGEHRRAGKVQCVPHRAHREVLRQDASLACNRRSEERPRRQLFVLAIDSGED